MISALGTLFVIVGWLSSAGAIIVILWICIHCKNKNHYALFFLNSVSFTKLTSLAETGQSRQDALDIKCFQVSHWLRYSVLTRYWLYIALWSAPAYHGPAHWKYSRHSICSITYLLILSDVWRLPAVCVTVLSMVSGATCHHLQWNCENWHRAEGKPAK